MLKFSQFYLLWLFFESDIPYVELYLKLTHWKFNSLPFILNIYTLKQLFCKQRRWLYLSKMQRKFSTVSKAMYGLYLKLHMIWLLVFRTYDQTLSWPSLPPIFLQYTSLQLKMHYQMLLFGWPIMFFHCTCTFY